MTLKVYGERIESTSNCSCSKHNSTRMPNKVFVLRLVGGVKLCSNLKQFYTLCITFVSVFLCVNSGNVNWSAQLVHQKNDTHTLTQKKQNRDVLRQYINKSTRKILFLRFVLSLITIRTFMTPMFCVLFIRNDLKCNVAKHGIQMCAIQIRLAMFSCICVDTSRWFKSFYTFDWFSFSFLDFDEWALTFA